MKAQLEPEDMDSSALPALVYAIRVLFILKVQEDSEPLPTECQSCNLLCQ